MQTEYETIIADTTCFILLDKIDELELLMSLFGHIVITPIIAKEFGAALPEWVLIREVKDVQFQSTLDIDPGEASAIALAMESGKSLLILDDNKGRKAARRLNLNFTGSLGIFLKAKTGGIIPSVRYILEKVQQTNFRHTPEILQEILSLAGE
jgi:predicted nucleic acid-binding protein